MWDTILKNNYGGVSTKKVIVIGAGASGLMASGIAGKNGNDVILIEKNDRAGKKLLITGKGRCNLTNIADMSEFMDNIPTNSSFLYSAFNSFNNINLIDFFNSLGVKTKVERGGRVFPVTDSSLDILDALLRFNKRNNVKILYNTEVLDIKLDNKKVCGVILAGNKEIRADKVIIATGGLSYPKTGSTGDGYKFAKCAGHNITKLLPSLVGIETEENWVKDLQGLSLKNVKFILKHKGKKIYEDFGEMLFTHYGVSGPIVLSGSRHLHSYLNDGKIQSISISIDLKPALTEEKLNLRIQRDFEKYINKNFENSLDELLPKRLKDIIIKESNISPKKKVNSITKEERKVLVNILKGLTLTAKGLRGFDEAIITSGGVKVNEVNPKTMESKNISGLYFCGEVLDIDAYTGGYNLQIAFSTGYLAGQ